MHLLVALDDSDPAWAALEFACAEHADDEITVVHVIDLAESGYGEFAHVGTEGMVEQREDDAAALLETARDRAAGYDCTIDTAVIHGRPADVIVDYATEHEVDRIVVGSHGRTGVSRILLGSVAEQIVRRAPVPVTIAR